MSKIVQIAVMNLAEERTAEGVGIREGGDLLFVLTDDGKIWERFNRRDWVAVPSPPGTDGFQPVS